MRSSADKEWTEKLQPAALAANTQVKRSTGHTAFYLMFGRDYDSSDLLNLKTSTSTSKPSMNPLENIKRRLRSRNISKYNQGNRSLSTTKRRK